MKKVDFIAKYGEEAWQKKLAQARAYYKAHKEEAQATTKKWNEEHPEEKKAYNKKWREEHPEEIKTATKRYNEEHPEQVIASHQEEHRKGGKHYDKHLKDKRTGLQGDKNKIRSKHAREYKPYKNIIAPESQIHHEWVPNTSEYRGIALVEAEQHMHGFVDVIEILDGEITLLTEEEIRNGGR